MKRLLAFGLSLGLVAALAVPVIATEEPYEVTICHLTSAGDPIPPFSDGDNRMFYLGKLEIVDPPSLRAHFAHGDSTTFCDGSAACRYQYGQYRTDAAGLANLYISAMSNGLKFWDEANCFITQPRF
jgi:hypothetical protein